MKFFLDENISPKTAAFLKELGLDAIHSIGAGLKGKPDSDVYEFCKKGRYVLVTFDHEFGFEYLSRKDLQGWSFSESIPRQWETSIPP